MSLRSILRVIALAALVAAGTQTFFLLALTDREAIGTTLSSHPDRVSSGYHELLLLAKETSQPGDSIALVYPITRWEGEDGYGYAFMRANYFLSDRRIIPLISPDGSRRPERVDEADWVVSWRTPISSPDLIEIASSDQGYIFKRVAGQ